MFIEKPASKISLAHRKPVFGVGINDAEYIVRTNRYVCPFYQRWQNMLERCYDHKYHQKYPTYIGCSVERRWLSFTLFKEWMISQQWKGMHLDKDLMYPGNKVYSSKCCIFVSSELNKLLNNMEAVRGRFPKGVCFDKQNKKFIVHCSVDGRSKHLGRFTTPEEASEVYITFKSKHIREIAEKHKSNRLLYLGLISHADILEKQLTK